MFCFCFKRPFEVLFRLPPQNSTSNQYQNNLATERALELVCRQLFQVRKMDFFSVLGYEPLIFDLDHTRAWSRKKSRTSKNQGYVEAFKKGYWGGNIEGAFKKVDLEKILSRTYLGRIFLKVHI
jgi:hypothetical protein